MPSTTTYGFPYPSAGDAPNAPAQILALAQAVEDKIELVDADEAVQKALIQGYAPPAQTGSGTLTVGGNGLTVMTVAIADPGFAYNIIASGSIGWAMAGATLPGNLCEGAITIDSSVYNTGRLVAGYSVSTSIGAGFTQPTLIVPAKRSDSFGALTGAHTVRLIARNTGSSNMTIAASGPDTTLTVRIVPT